MTNKDYSAKIWVIPVLVFVGVIILYAMFWWIVDSSITDAQLRGVFGDKFGAVNALFSGLAFAGLIITLFLQKSELALQREELQLTREEMKSQRSEFVKENETLKLQRFENLFYNMLNLQQEIVNDLRAEYNYEDITAVPLANGGQGYENRNVRRVVIGRDVFRYAFESEEFYLKYNDGRREKIQGLRNLLHRRGLEGYDEYWAPTVFDHYFRHLYKIVQFVDSQDFSYEEAYRYVSFLRGTLSKHELAWIYYNALQPAYIKFKVLIEKYALLKNLRHELLTLTKETEDYYIERGLTDEIMRPKGFSTRDFEFYLTDDSLDNSRYHLGAFWKQSEIEEGRLFLNNWNNLLREVSKEEQDKHVSHFQTDSANEKAKEV